MLQALAKRHAHAAENGFFRHGQHRAGVAADAVDEIFYRLFELRFRDEAIHHAEFQSTLGGHRLAGQNKFECDLGPNQERQNR